MGTAIKHLVPDRVKPSSGQSVRMAINSRRQKVNIARIKKKVCDPDSPHDHPLQQNSELKASEK